MLFQSSVLILSGFYIFYTDIKYRKITNQTNLSIALMGLIYSIYSNVFIGHLLSSLLLGGTFLLLAVLTKGFGMGDVKYIFATAFLLGIEIALTGLLIGFLIGGVYAVYLIKIRKAKATDTFAYGPFLVIGNLLGFIITLI